MAGEQQYLNLCKRILEEGEWVENERTGKRCKTVINADFVYDVGNKVFPILTTKQVFWKSAVAEIIGYFRGYTSAADFRKLGSKSWDMNANKTEDWLNNRNREGKDHLGKIYGAVGHDFGGIDLFNKVYQDLIFGVDDRSEIISFWNPPDFNKGCLKPCMYSWHFSLVGDTLHLTTNQRSVDVPLGLPWNMIQCYVILDIMAQITGNKSGKVYHKMVNCHVYEDQIEPLKKQLERQPLENNSLFSLPEDLVILDDVLTWLTPSDCTLEGYEHQGKIEFPFSE